MSNCNRHGAEAARRAHNPEVTRSKRVVGIYRHHIAQVHQGTGATLTPLTQRQSARAHNLGVTGSKPVGGIQIITSHRCIKALEQHNTCNRGGAEVARRAHNPKDIRSKRILGI